MSDEWTVLESEIVFAARPYVVVTREAVRPSRGQLVDDFYRVDLGPFLVGVPQRRAVESLRYGVTNMVRGAGACLSRHEI